MDTYVSGSNYGNYSSSLPENFWIVIMLVLGIVAFIFLIITVITIIGQWKMFKKAGKKGWEALIPIYNIYTLCLITGVHPVWIPIVIGLGFFSYFTSIFSFISSMAMIYFGILLAVSTARSFGKEDGYALGLYFLGPFFQLALGIGKSEYLGPKPMDDIILKSFGTKQSTSATSSKTTEKEEPVVGEKPVDGASRHYCSNCGTEIVINTKYCPNCGKEL